MANRRFEMHEYRHILVRMRLGETDRQIARAGLMGRRKAAAVRRQAEERGWLDPARPLPADEVLAETLTQCSPRPQTTSQVQPFEQDVRAWRRAGIQGTTIHQALVRKQRINGFTGSYSSVRRFLQALVQAEPEVTTVLDFEPGDVAQVDFGRGPKIVDVHTGELIHTWIFTLVLAWSRHLYAELVPDQSVPTWLGCHRRAFEYYGGVPARLIIDNLKSAITGASYHDPAVQRTYAELAEGYGFRLAPHPVRQPQMKGRIEAGVKYVKHAFVPLRALPQLGRRQPTAAGVAAGSGGQPHPRHHPRAPPDPVCRGRALSARPPAGSTRRGGRVGPGQSPRRLSRAVCQMPILRSLSTRASIAVAARCRDHGAHVSRP